jgi:hypothetical protein
MLNAGFNCTCSIFCTEFLLQMFWTKVSSLDFSEIRLEMYLTIFTHHYSRVAL